MANSSTTERPTVVYLDLDENKRAGLALQLAADDVEVVGCVDVTAVTVALASVDNPLVLIIDVDSVGTQAALELVTTLSADARPRVRDSRRLAIFRDHNARTASPDWPVHKQLVQRALNEHTWELRGTVLLQLQLQAALIGGRANTVQASASGTPVAAPDVGLRDALTGLYTHGAFQERLREEVARADRYGQPMSLIIIDIDQFSTVNYDLGYSAGDEVLRRIASALADTDAGDAVRRSDIAARHSGGEFVLLLPETRKAGALTRAARLRDAVAAMQMPGARLVSLSMGVACFPDDAADSDSLLAAAEAALRGAKRAGPRTTANELGRIHFFAANSSHDSTSAMPGTTRTFERERQLVVDRFRPYHDRLGEVTGMLQRDRAISCLLVDLTRLRRVELDLGIAHHTEIYDRAANVLDALRGSLLTDTDLICRTGDGDGYLVFLSNRASAAPGGRFDLEALALAVEEAVESSLAPAARELLREQPRITVGSARVLGNSMLRPERLITRLIADAGTSARIARERSLQRHKAALQDIILGDGLTSVYQPIVDLRTSDIFAFEALTRGPKNTAMESPVTLFGVADEVDLTFELDRACFRRALRSAVGLPPVHRLFVNLLPMSFYDASFIELEVSNLLNVAGLTPANIVFEITEKLAIENFASFRRALATYTAMGFGVAIDDVGTRHSNLETVMALRPHFIKISDVLVRGIARSPVKREMMRSLGRIAEAIDAVVVAEGIETPDDLAVLRDLGLRYGQGYFMARPGAPFPELLPGVQQTIAEIASSQSAHRTQDWEMLNDEPDEDGNEVNEADRAAHEVRIVRPPGTASEHRITARHVASGSIPPSVAAGSTPALPINAFREDEITNDFAKPLEPLTGVGSSPHPVALPVMEPDPASATANWTPITNPHVIDEPPLLQSLVGTPRDHAENSDGSDELPPFEDTRA